MRPETAILIVNGGPDPPCGRWLELCLGSIRRHTPPGTFRLLVWNNNAADSWVDDLVVGGRDGEVMKPGRGESLAHPHAVPLQRLFDRARADGHDVVVTLDSDAFPIRTGWLEALRSPLEQGAAVAGVWRDDNRDVIEPYVHPCCLAIKTKTVLDLGLRFDKFPWEMGEVQDTLSAFTRVALEKGLPLHRWYRSNRNSVDPLMGGLYGDYLYHQGATTRRATRYWGKSRDPDWEAEIRRFREECARLAFSDMDGFAAWMRGRPVHSSGSPPVALILVLGMRWSGVGVLVSCLQACGVPFPGYPSRLHVSPRVSKLLRDLEDASQEMTSGARAEVERRAMDALAALDADGPVGLAGPAVLETVGTWKRLAPGRVAVLGTFSHPTRATRLLHAVDPVAGRRGLDRWIDFHHRLRLLQATAPFPLVEYGDSAPRDYARRVGALAISLGVDPDVRILGELAEEEGVEPLEPTVARSEAAHLLYLELQGSASGGSTPSLGGLIWDFKCRCADWNPGRSRRSLVGRLLRTWRSRRS